MKIFIGTVVSKKMAKTATVIVERVVVHPVYKKRVRLTKKYQVHDESESGVGQKVKFTASKPLSKTKKWKIIEVIKDESGKAVKTKTASLKKGGRQK